MALFWKTKKPPKKKQTKKRFILSLALLSFVKLIPTKTFFKIVVLSFTLFVTILKKHTIKKLTYQFKNIYIFNISSEVVLVRVKVPNPSCQFLPHFCFYEHGFSRCVLLRWIRWVAKIKYGSIRTWKLAPEHINYGGNVCVFKHLFNSLTLFHSNHLQSLR